MSRSIEDLNLAISEIDRKVAEKTTTVSEKTVAKQTKHGQAPDLDSEIAELEDQIYALENPPIFSNNEAQYDDTSRALNIGGGVINAGADLLGGFLELPQTINEFVSDDADSSAFDMALKRLSRTGEKFGRSTDFLYNPINAENAAREFGKAYDDSTGFWDGASRLVGVAVSNPGTAVETFMTSLPHMLALAKTGAVGAVSFMNIVGTQLDEEMRLFAEDNPDREMTENEMATALASAIAAVAIDKVQSKFILGKKITDLASKNPISKNLAKVTERLKDSKIGELLKKTPYGATIARAPVATVGELGQEASQEVLTQIGAGQDFTTVENLRDTYIAGGMGFGAGAVGGLSVQGIKDTGKALKQTKDIVVKGGKATKEAYDNQFESEAKIEPVDNSASPEFAPETVNTRTLSDGTEQQIEIDDNTYDPRAAAQAIQAQDVSPTTTPAQLEKVTAELALHISNMGQVYFALSPEDRAKEVNQAYFNDLSSAVKTQKKFNAISNEQDLVTINNEESTEVEKSEANARIFGSISNSGLTEQELVDYLASATGLLSPEQLRVAKAAKNTAGAKEALELDITERKNRAEKINKTYHKTDKNYIKVNDDIIHGNSQNGMLGGEQHIIGITESIEQGKVDEAVEKLNRLIEFRNIHADRQKLLDHMGSNKSVEEINGPLRKTLDAEDLYLNGLVEQAQAMLDTKNTATTRFAELKIKPEVEVVNTRLAELKKAQQDDANIQASVTETAQDKLASTERVARAAEALNKAKEEAEKAPVTKPVKKEAAKSKPVVKKKAPVKQATQPNASNATVSYAEQIKEALNKVRDVAKRYKATTEEDKHVNLKEATDATKKLINQLRSDSSAIDKKLASIQAELDHRVQVAQGKSPAILADPSYDGKSVQQLDNIVKILNQRKDFITDKSSKLDAYLQQLAEDKKSFAKEKHENLLKNKNSLFNQVVRFVAVAHGKKNLDPATGKPYPPVSLKDLYYPIKRRVESAFRAQPFNESEPEATFGSLETYTAHVTEYINKSKAPENEKHNLIQQAIAFYKNFTEFKEALKTTSLKAEEDVPTIYTQDVFLDPSLMLLKRSNPETAGGDGTLLWTDEVVGAMAAASSMWLKEEGGKTFTNYKKDINAFLGRNEEHNVLHEEERILKDVGVLRTLIARSIGRRVFDTLNISLGTKESAQYEAKMIESIGHVVLHTMETQGLIQFKSIETSKIAEFHTKDDNPLEVSEKTAVFVKVLADPAEKLLDNNIPIQAVLDNYAPFDKAPNLGKVLFGLETFTTGPSDHIPSHVQDQSGDGFSNVPAFQQRVLDKHGKRPNRINVEDATKLLDYGDEFIHSLMGYINLDKAHDQNITSNHSFNEGINKDITSLKDAIESFGDKAIYFTHEVWANSRMGIISNTLNPQASKLHRFFVQPETQLVKNIDPRKTSKKTHQFKLAVALAFGIGEKEGANVGIKFFDKLVRNQDFRRALLVLDRESNPENGKKIINYLNSVDIDGVGLDINAHAFQALTEVNKYKKAIKAKGTFDSWLGIETDGVTNGSAIGMMQFPILKSMSQWFERVGVFAPNTYESYPEWNAASDSLDSYEYLMKGVVEQLHGKGKDKNFNAAIELLLGDLAVVNQHGIVTEVLKAGRDFAKNPFMIFNYGSKIQSIRKALGHSIIDNIYSKLETIEEIIDPKEQQVELDKLNLALATIAQKDLKIKIDKDAKGKIIRDEKGRSSLLTDNIEASRNLLYNRINKSIGNAFENVLTEYLGEFTKTRDTINNAFKLQWKIFRTEYDKEVYAVSKKRVADGLNPALSKQDVKNILAKLDRLVPGFTGAMSNSVNERITVMKTDKRYDDSGRVKVLFQLAHEIIDENGNKKEASSSSSHVAEKVFVDGGVSGLVKMVHTIDSTIMTKLMDEFSIVNIHDAVIANSTESAEIAKRYNELFLQTTLDYSIIDDVNKMLARSLGISTKTKAIVNQYAKDELGYEKGTKGLIADLRKVNQNLDNLHQQYFARGAVIDQMVHISGGSAYVSEGIRIEKLKLQLARLEARETKIAESKTIPEKELELQRIGYNIEAANAELDSLRIAAENLSTEQAVEIETEIKQTTNSNFVNHSGGALGSDTVWGEIGAEFGVISNHYYTGEKTPNGNSEISQEDIIEGQAKVTIAARQMGRIQPTHQVRSPLLIRNWAQVKYADMVVAVTTMLREGADLNYGKKALTEQGKGGTGYAIQMAINEGKPVYVFDQRLNKWFKNINGKWENATAPVLTKNFAGIGTRQINANGKQAIRDAYENTFNTTKDLSTEQVVQEEVVEEIDQKTINIPPRIKADDETHRAYNITVEIFNKFRNATLKEIRQKHKSLVYKVQQWYKKPISDENMYKVSLIEEDIGAIESILNIRDPEFIKTHIGHPQTVDGRIASLREALIEDVKTGNVDLANTHQLWVDILTLEKELAGKPGILPRVLAQRDAANMGNTKLTVREATVIEDISSSFSVLYSDELNRIKEKLPASTALNDLQLQETALIKYLVETYKDEFYEGFHEKQALDSLAKIQLELESYGIKPKEIPTYVGVLKDPNKYGSSAREVDTTKFTHTPVTKVTSKNVKAVYDNIPDHTGRVVSPAFKAQLDRVINVVLENGIKPLDELIFKIHSEEQDVFGAQIGSTIYMNNGAPSRKSAVAQSPHEVYVHEMLHAVLGDALTNDTDVKHKVRELYNVVITETQKLEHPEDIFLRKDTNGDFIFLNSETEERAMAKEMYDYIFANGVLSRDAEKGLLNNSLHEFMIYGLSNEQFTTYLSSIPVSRSARLGLDATVLDRLLDFLSRILDRFFTGNQALSSDVVSDELFNTAKNVAMAHKATQKRFIQIIESSLKIVPNVLNTVVEGAKKTGKAAVGTTPSKIAEGVKKVVNKTNEKVFAGEDHEAAMVTIAKTITGLSNKYPKVFDLLRESKHTIDNERIRTEKAGAQQVLDSFIDKDSTVEQREALTIGLLSTDVDSILDDYGMDGLKKLLAKDPTYLSAQIHKYNKLVMGVHGGFEYNQQAKNLGQFMVTGQTGITNQMFNAKAIAQASYLGKTRNVAPATIKNIDTLATLYALQNLTQYTRQTVLNTILSEESKADAIGVSEHGVSNLLTMYRGFKNHSKVQLFSGNELLMTKGFTSDVSDPAVKIEVNLIDEETQQDMRDAGYILDSKLPHDPNLPNRLQEVGLYVSKHNASTPILKATVSLTDTHNRGTLLMGTLEGDAADRYRELRRIHQIFSEDTSNRVRGKVSKEPVFLSPIINRHGEIVNYRYMMSESAKTRLLDKDRDAATVMGAMNASVVSKVNSETINKKVVDIAYDDFKENYNAKTAKDYILVNGRKDNYYHELSLLMPDHMKEYIRKVFGTDGIYVRKELADIIFGYRKMSLANSKILSGKAKEDANYFIKHFGNSTSRRYLRRIVQITESLWQELIAHEKVNIVIKTPQVLFDNVLSNTVMLLVRGISPAEIFRGYRLAIKDLNHYQKDNAELTKLTNLLRGDASLKDDKKFMAHYARITDAINTNSVKELVDKGVFQTIVEDVTINKYGYKGQLHKWVDRQVPDYLKRNSVVTGVKYALMTEDTKLFKFMHKATAYSDFMGRYVLYNNQIKKGVDPEQAILDAVDSFINYDAPDARILQYLNDIGLFMFTKFFLRIQRIIVKQFGENTANSLIAVGLQMGIADISDIVDSNPIETSVTDRMYPNIIKHIDTATAFKGAELLPGFGN